MRHHASLVLLAGLAVTGICPVLVRFGDVGPISLAFWRMILSAPFLTVAWHWQERRDGLSVPLLARDGWLLAAAGLFFAADLAVWRWALILTRMINATLLGSLSPVFVVVFGWLFLRHRVRARFLVGMAVAMGGTAILSVKGVEFSATSVVGDGLALLAAAFYAGYFLVIGGVRRRFCALQITSWGAWTAAFSLLPLALLEERFWPSSLDGWMVALAIAALGQIGQVLIAQSLKLLTPSMGALLGQAQPFWSSGLAWWWLGEQMTALQFFAGAVVLLGVLIARRSGGP